MEVFVTSMLAISFWVLSIHLTSIADRERITLNGFIALVLTAAIFGLGSFTLASLFIGVIK